MSSAQHESPQSISKVLVATGLTPESVGGVLTARWLAREFDAELVLFDGVAHEMTDEMNDQLHAWLAEELGVLVDQGVRRGLLDGGVRPCAPPGWPMGAGWPDAGLPEAGWPDGSFPDAGPWWECPDGGPLDAASDASLDAGARWSPLRRPAAAPAR